MGVGGPIIAVGLDGRNFTVAGEAGDSNRFLGGVTNEVRMNGDGQTARIIKTPKPFSATGLALSVDNDLGDQEFINALALRNSFFPCTVTYADGITYQGTGQIVGDADYKSGDSTLPIDIMGTGQFTQQ